MSNGPPLFEAERESVVHPQALPRAGREFLVQEGRHQLSEVQVVFALSLMLWERLGYDTMRNGLLCRMNLLTSVLTP